MKKIGQSLLALVLFVFMAGAAMAQDGKLFYNSTSPERWVETQKLWEKDGILVGENLVVEKIYPILKGIAVEDKHPAAELSDQAFAVEMARRNPGLPATGTVKAEVLRFLAQGNGIYLPTPAAVAAVLSGTRKAALPEATGDGKQAVTLANMEAQVKELKAALEKSDASKSELTALGKRLTALGKQVDALQSGQSDFATTGDITAINQTLTKLKGDVSDVTKLQTDVTGLMTNYNGLSERLTAVEQHPFLAMGNKLMAAFGLLVIGCAMVAAILWRRGGDVKKVADSALATAQKVEADMEEVQGAIGKLDLAIPGDIEQKLSALAVGGRHEVFIGVEGENKALVFTKVDDKMVEIAGISTQLNAVRIDNVVRRIRRAAGAGHLTGVQTLQAVNAQPLRAA